jgi:hypothetical protein
MKYDHRTARYLFRNLFGGDNRHTNLHFEHMSRGDKSPLRKYWGVLNYDDDIYTGHQEDMVLLLNEAVGESDD